MNHRIDSSTQAEAQSEVRHCAEESTCLQASGEIDYRAVFQLAPDGMLVADRDSNYLDANPRICAMLGYSRDELIRMGAQDIIAPAEHAGIAETLAAIHEGSRYRREWRFRRKDGSQFDAEVQVNPLADGTIVACVREMGDRREAEANALRLAAIVESSEDAITSTNLDNVITSWNGGAERMTGYRADEAVGRPFAILLPPASVEQDEQVVAAILGGENVAHFESERLRKDGSRLIVSSSASPVRDAVGNVTGISRISRDITQQRDNERELARLSQLYAALSQINQAIVWQSTRPALLQKVCEALVEYGAFSAAWVGMVNQASQRMEPLATCGDSQGYLDALEVFVDARADVDDPIAAAYGEGRTQILDDALSDASTAHWRASMPGSGLRAAIALPIFSAGIPCGTLNVYSSEPGFFGRREVALLEEAAGNLSFALDSLNREVERQRIQAAMHDEREFSNTMIESMPGILYFYDWSGRFLRWNRNFERVTGYESAEIAGMHPLDFFTHSEQQQVGERIAEVFSAGESYVEAMLRRKDGALIPYLFTGRRVAHGGTQCLIGMGVDISERKQAEAALRETELRFHTLFDAAPVGVLVVDPQTTGFFEFNDQIARQLGYSRDAFAGLRLADIDASAPEADIDNQMEQLAADGRGQFETLHRTRDGELRDVLVTAQQIELAGRKLLQYVFLDITERKRAESLLRELNETLEARVAERTRELREALVRAGESDRLKSAFLATMSHELRTPLNSIIGFTGIMLQGLPGPINDEQSKQLGMVRGSARHLLALIGDVLDISKIEAGQLEVRAEPFTLSESVHRVADSLRLLASAKGLSLDVSLDPTLDEVVSDRRRVEQILLNLVGNAIKFTEQGGVTLSAGRIDAIFPSLKTPVPTVELTVRDTGPGIRSDDLASLFQPFRQIESGLTRRHEGTGLGLAICKRLAELLGGTISVESTWQEGSTFTLVLPLNRPEAA